MRVLIVKTSSMGDVIHTLPALTDAVKAIPHIRFDWVVEEAFAEIPAWHPAVDQVIPIAWRRWRKNLKAPQTQEAFKAFVKRLREREYDLVLDAQGLVKSALLTRAARGRSAGLDWGSAREPLASLLYQKKCSVNFYQHAIVRMRAIFANLLNYELPQTVPDYGVPRSLFLENSGEDYLVFLHGTTWETKLWPESYWIALAKLAERQGLAVKVLWGNAEEEARAKRLAQAAPNLTVLPRQDLKGSAKVLANARAVVAVDTGFAHLAAALDVPGVSVYGPTNPDYSGALGRNQICLAANFPCAPCLKRDCTYQGRAQTSPACFTEVNAEKVWKALGTLIEFRSLDEALRA